MTYWLADYHGHVEALDGPKNAGAIFADQAEMLMSHGRAGQAIWFGAQGQSAVLRIDVDVDRDRAAVRWLPDGSYAVEVPADTPLIVLESAESALVEIPASLARVTVATARRIVEEYVGSRRKPTSVLWTTD